MSKEILIKTLSRLIKELNQRDLSDFNDDLELKNNKILDTSKFTSYVESFIKQKWWIRNVLMHYKNSINWINFSSHDWEKHILWLVEIDELIKRDNKRYILWTVPFANYVFNTLKNKISGVVSKKIVLDKLDVLSDNNPFRQKYENKNIQEYEEKFECLRDYINENSFAIDAANIWWMSWATDFLQLYKYVMLDETISSEYDRKLIITELFNLIQTKDIEDFIKQYDIFIQALKEKNTNDDKRLSRLYNRLYFILSFILNNLYPEIFPIYFSATRSVLRVFWVEWYENVANLYKEFLKTEGLKTYIDEYLEWVWISENDYWLSKYKGILPFNKELFENHARYRFFQDICWVIARNILDWQDYVNNLWKWETFKLKDYENKIYPFEWDKDWKLLENDEKTENKKITFWEIINIEFLISEWYITEISPWEYKVIKTDTYFMKDIK